MLLGTLGTKRMIFRNIIRHCRSYFLGNMLAGKVMVRAGSRNKTEKRIVRAGYGKEMSF